MNNGPWGTGMHPGYTAWSSRNGQVTFNPQSTFNPQTYQQAYGQRPQAQSAMTAPPSIDWASLLGLGGNKQGQTPHITTSIQARPIYGQTQVNDTLGQYGNFMPQGGGTAANLYKQEAQRARINADRTMTGENANMLLGSQKARSDAGLRWGAVTNQQNQLNNAIGADQQGYAMALLRAIGAI